MMKYRSILALANVVLFLTAVKGDVRLPGIIGDHMVLQQDRPILIWGWADPGETVVVTIGSDQGRTVARNDGRWNVKLPARKAGGPVAVIVEGHNRLVINDVLIGEVWLCSGQSNMQFAMNSTSHAKEDIAAADYPKIRLFTVPKECSLDPLADTRGAWSVCSPVTAGRFSAVAYFFGRELFKELRSPVGLIASSWGGTNAEEWTKPDFLSGVPDLEPILRRWEDYDVSLQYSFTSNDMLEVTFMGSDGRRLHDGGLRRNQPTRADWEDQNMNPFAWVWDQGSAAAAGVPYPYPGFSGQAGFAVTPFPQVANTWGPLYYVESPLGSSSYRSLQFAYTRRMSEGLAANFSYSFSKAKGNTEVAFQETWADNGAGSWYRGGITPVQDAYDLEEAADTVTSFDQAHIFKGLATYALPFGQGRRWLSGSRGVVDAILGGWNTSIIFRYASGFPLSIGTNVWYPGWQGGVYADVLGDPTPVWDSEGFDPASPRQYFPAAAFANPKDHKLGNGKRLYDNLRTFGDVSEDIGIMKYWGLGEAARLQFRMEMLNAFNRHTFADPVTSLGNKANFGKVMSAAGDPRVIQMGLRVNW